MGKRVIRFALASCFLSLCLAVLQARATSGWDDQRDMSNAITGKLNYVRVGTSTVDFTLQTKNGVTRRYQLCKSDLRGRSPSVNLLQSAFQSKGTVIVYPSDAFNSCVDDVAAVQEEGGKP